MAEPMDYASAGVDIDLEGAAVASLIGSLQRFAKQELQERQLTYPGVSED